MDTVQRISFDSHRPEDHLIRTIGLVAKMGFQLHSAVLRPPPALPVAIEISFVCKGDLGVHTLLDRIAQMPGVENARALTAAKLDPRHQTRTQAKRDCCPAQE